ncbi:PAS domain S-box protein [Microcoleus sp. CAWBG640]|uniref:PAS domain S-box protein n=1 Tax=Microcoleus sp. CAWBG640 TaxID=2841653 RepID=UPI00312BB401
MQIYSNSSKVTDGATPSEADSFLLNSEETYKTLVANIPGAIYRCIWDLSDPTAGKRRMAFLSEAIQEISGYPASDFVNDRVRDFASIIHPQDRKNVEALLLQSVVSKTPYILEYRIVRHDGGISWVYEKGKPVYCQVKEANLASNSQEIPRELDLKTEIENGNISDLKSAEKFRDSLVSYPGQIPDSQLVVVCFDGVILDITDRRQTEEILRERESYYRCIVETASEGVWMFDSESKTTFANSRMAEMLGYTVEEIQGRSLFEFIDDNTKEIANIYVQRRRQGIRERHDFQFTRKDGSHLWAIVSATPMFDVNGEFSGVLRMITDISDRKQAEAELWQTLQELEFEKFALDQSAIVSNTDEFGAITYVNDQFCELFKYHREELIGKTHRLVNSSYHSADFFKQLWSTIRQGNVWRGEMKNRAKDGTYFWLDTTIVPCLNAKGEPHQYVAIRKNITARKKAEEAVRLSESELRTKNQELAKALRDVQQTQSLMVQNEKMVSLGQLVAGVAHEINNPVSFIYGNVMHADDYFQDLLKMLLLYQKEYPEPTEAIREEIDDIDLNFMLQDLPKLLNSMKMGAERIRQIVLSLKNFSRLDEAGQKHVDIHEGIDSSLLILQHRLKETPGHPKILLVKEYGDLPCVQCYAGQLNQVFMNIIGNAIDALEEAMETGQWAEDVNSFIPSCPSPTLRICTEVKYEPDVLMERNNVVYDASSRNPTHIVIRIADNGPGIPAAVHQRLFDPFFTTKAPGKGTGLGLSISYQIVVEKHGGQLHCYSAPGQGTEFAIEIPIVSSH